MRTTLSGLNSDIKARTPIRTGKMAASVRTRIIIPKDSSGNKPTASGRVGYRASRRRVTASRLPSVGQVLGVEYGNVRVPVGRETIEIVFALHQSLLRSKFIKNFRIQFNKRLKREAKKRQLEYRSR